MKTLFISVCLLLIQTFAAAQSTTGGNNLFEFGAAIAGPNQSDINTWITGTNTAGTNQLGTAYEYSVAYYRRIAGSMFALGFRPSYMTQSASGGNINVSYTGLMIYPMLRLYPLENNFIHFYLEAGMGWGQLSGSISQGSANASFTASAFGAAAGIGAQFCFTPSICMTVAGLGRYNPTNRSLVSSQSGTFTNNLSGSVGHELEYNNLDVQNTLSTVEGVIAFTYKL